MPKATPTKPRTAPRITWNREAGEVEISSLIASEIFAPLLEKLNDWALEEDLNGILARKILKAKSTSDEAEVTRLMAPFLQIAAEHLDRPPVRDGSGHATIDFTLSGAHLASLGISERYLSPQIPDPVEA